MNGGAYRKFLKDIQGRPWEGNDLQFVVVIVFLKIYAFVLGGEGQKERESLKQTPCRAQSSTENLVSGPWDHELSWNHPGTQRRRHLNKDLEEVWEHSYEDRKVVKIIWLWQDRKKQKETSCYFDSILSSNQNVSKRLQP